MGGLTSAVHWWEEWQLRVLVLTSMAIQIFLFVFAFLRRFAIPRWVRSITWLAYLGGDAVAIYALATLFNRHKTADPQHLGGGSPSTVELIWVPILLLHLGGNDGITAYNIEDNELWSRHLLTAVSQVTVAIYVFKKSWPPPPAPGGYDYLYTAAILLFIGGVLKCFVKPWALKKASIYSLVSLGAAKQNEGERYSLQEYVSRAKEIILKKEAPFVGEQNSDDVEAGAQRAKSHKEPAAGTDMKELIIKTISVLIEVNLVGVYIKRLLLSKKDDEEVPTQGSFCGRLGESLRERERVREERSKHQREMLQQRDEAWKQFVDLSSAYPRRLSILDHFWGLSRKGKAYGTVRQRLATAFLFLYTKHKTTSFIDKDISQLNGVHIRLLVKWMVELRVVLPCLSIGLFYKRQREPAYNDTIIDVKITYVMLYCTAVLEAISLFVWMAANESKSSLRAWPEMVAQYSVIGYFARSRRHGSWMWVASLFQCKDFLDQHWCMNSGLSSSREISELVLRYLKDDGWKKEIHDAPSYRRFNDHNSCWVLERNLCNSQVPGRRTNSGPLPFDESVLIWHIATDFCFFFSSSFSVSEHVSASAKDPATTILMRITEINEIRRGGRSREMVSKVLPAGVTSSSVNNYDEIKSQCRQMSNYLVYLLFVNPEMLLPGTRRKLFTAAYNDLRDIFHGDNKFAVAYNDIKDILTDQKDNILREKDSIQRDKENVYTRLRKAMKELKEIVRDSNRNPIGWSQWKPGPVKKKKIMKRVIRTMLNKSANKASVRKGCEEESKEESPRQENFIDDAWVLAQQLLELGDEKMWKVIQGVWVEMLCFSASRCRGYLHAKALGNGGEFLSYIWLLLFHMGMETFTDKLQREEPPIHKAGNDDTSDLTREISSSTARLQREHLTSQQGGKKNKNKGTASTPTYEISEAAHDMV